MNPFEHDPESPLLNEARKHIRMDIPEGYADELQERLRRIPSEYPTEQTARIHVLRNWKTWSFVAAAACLLAAVLILPSETTKNETCTTFDCMVEAWALEEAAMHDLSASLIEADDLSGAFSALDVEPELFASIDDTTMVLYLNDGYLSDLELYGLLLNE